MDTICALDAEDLSRRIHARAIGCRETALAYLDRIDAINPAFNAIVSLRERADVLRDADERDAQLARGESLGWLHGVPLAIKDLAATRGLRTTWGSPIYRDHVPLHDSAGVARIRAAGAVLVGKTNTPEFGLGSHTYNTVFGATRNPYAPERCAGGSSGGAAAALALRLLPVADGSDFGGSLRNPAAFNNVWGLRPSQGRVAMAPVDEAFVSQLGYEGPMARSVRDLARLLAVQAGHDPRAPLSLPDDPAFTAALARIATVPATAGIVPPTGSHGRPPRIGWLGDYDGHLAMEPGVLEVCGQGLHALRGLGCEVEPAAPGFDPESIWRSFVVIRQWLTGGKLRAHFADPKRRALLKPEARWEIEGALRLSALDVWNACELRTRWFQRVLALFERFDFLALPSAQVFPFPIEQPWPRQIAGREMDSYHRWMEVVAGVTLSGCPALAMPAGFDPRGLPMGIQIVGRPRDEATLLRLGLAYEAATRWVERRPPPDGV